MSEQPIWNVAYLDKIGWEDSLPLWVLEAIRSEDILLATIGGIGRVLLLGSLLLRLLLHSLPVPVTQAVQHQLLISCRHHRTIWGPNVI